MGIKSALKNLITKAGGTTSSKTISGLINDYANVQGGGGSGGDLECIKLTTCNGAFLSSTGSDNTRIYQGGGSFPDNKSLKDIVGDKRIVEVFAVYENGEYRRESDPITWYINPNPYARINVCYHQTDSGFLQSISSLNVDAVFHGLNESIAPTGMASCDVYVVCV